MENNKDAIFDWICKTIDTCFHDFHFDAIDRLIDLYYEQIKDEQKRAELILKKQQKWNEIHFILK
jgi:hypothetical protein